MHTLATSQRASPKASMEDSNRLVEQFFVQQRAKFSQPDTPPIIDTPPVIEIEDDEEEMSPPSFGSEGGVYHSNDPVFTDSEVFSQSLHTLPCSPVIKQVKIRNMCGGRAIKDAAHRALIELENIHVSPHPKSKESSQEDMEVGGEEKTNGQEAMECGNGARAVDTSHRQELE